jgi:ABC-type multidrug transport system permease subunit
MVTCESHVDVYFRRTDMSFDRLYMLFELYFASFAAWVAALSPNSVAASILFSTFFSFVIICE